MTILDTARGFFWASFFVVVACSTQAELLKVTAGINSLALNQTHIEQAMAGEDAAGNSYVRLTLSEKGTSNLASFTESHIGQDLEIFHGAKSLYGKVTIRDKLVMKEIFVSVENKTEANKLADSIESHLRPRAAPH